MEGVAYKAGVGSFIYAMMATRANISSAVNMVSQFMLKVDPLHWMAVKRIMRYLKDTLDFKLYLGRERHYLERFWRCELGGRCKQLTVHHGVCVFCWCYSYFMEMQETTNHCIFYDEDGDRNKIRDY